MSHRVPAGIVDARAAFDAYCTRHCVSQEAAITELVQMALGLPADILDYLREQSTGAGAAA